MLHENNGGVPLEKAYLFDPEEILLEKKSILVIDDSVDMLELLKIMLQPEGFEVVTAESGTEAFFLLSKMDAPNLILLDMQMEDMTGLQFLDLLAEKKQKIFNTVPIVFLTGVDEVPQTNAVGFIRKPADMNELIKAVHGFIKNTPYTH